MQVHAVILDLGGGPETGEQSEGAVGGIAPDGLTKKGRTVRFEEVSEQDIANRSPVERSQRSDPSFSSSFSLSKYRFPETPGAARAADVGE